MAAFQCMQGYRHQHIIRVHSQHQMRVMQGILLVHPTLMGRANVLLESLRR